MPQSTHRSMTHVLLLWTTILSIIQASFIIFFFTTGHHRLSQNSSIITPEHAEQSKANNTPSPPTSSPERLLGAGRMLTYKATEVGGKLIWLAKNPMDGPVSEGETELKIQRDGYYFLNLQVKLKTCTCSCNGTRESERKVSLKWKDKILLQGLINTSTCSTGLLGKVEELSAGGHLRFEINSPISDIDDTESLTHLDIIFMVKS